MMVAGLEALRKKERQDETQFRYHQKWWLQHWRHSGKRKDRMKLSLGTTKIDGFLVLCLDNCIVGRVWIRVSIVMSSIPFIWWVPNLPPCGKLFSCNRGLTRLLVASSHPSSLYSQRGRHLLLFYRHPMPIGTDQINSKQSCEISSWWWWWWFSWWSQKRLYLHTCFNFWKRKKILFSIVAGSFSHTTPGDCPEIEQRIV